MCKFDNLREGRAMIFLLVQYYTGEGNSVYKRDRLTANNTSLLKRGVLLNTLLDFSSELIDLKF